MKNILVFLILVFSLTFFTRMMYIYKEKPYEWSLSRIAEMERAGFNLADKGWIGNIYSDDSGVSAHVAPLYPLLLAAIYSLAGPDVPLRLLAQGICAVVAISLFVALLPLLAARMKLQPGVGPAAAILMAVLPVNLWIETSGSWEQPYVPLLLALLVVAFAKVHDQQWTSWPPIVALGAVLGVATLFSPILLITGAFMLMGEWIVLRGARSRVLTRGAVLVLTSALVVSPWIVRNYRVFSAFVPVRSNFGLELYIGNNPQSDGSTGTHSKNSPLTQLHPFHDKAQLEELKRVGEIAFMRAKLQAAKDWIVAHPERFAELTARRFRLYWLSPRELWPSDSTAVPFKSVVLALTSLVGFAGLASLFLIRHPYRWLLFGVIIGTSFIYMIIHTDPRYRYPIFGFQLLLGAEFIALVTRAAARYRN